MRRQEMLEAVRVRPFRPFRIRVSDGGTYDIRHPEVVMVTRTSAVVGLPEPDTAPPAVQKYCVVDLLHITRLERIDTPSLP